MFNSFTSWCKSHLQHLRFNFFPAPRTMFWEYLIMIYDLINRLVNLTESIWLKIDLNMTETDKPFLFEHYRKVTTMNLNGWIWPKIKNILSPGQIPILVLKRYILFSNFGHIHPLRLVVVVIFIIFSAMFTNFGHIHSVIFIRSC